MQKSFSVKSIIALIMFGLLPILTIVVVQTDKKQSLRSQAHTVNNTQTIGALIHIDPNDEPKTNEVATITFTVKDTTDRFDGKDCICVLTITTGTKEIYKKTISGTKLELSAKFTFTEPGSYTLLITGTPKTGATFDNFSFSFDTEVKGNDKTQSTKASPSNQAASYIKESGNKANGILSNPIAILGPIISLTVIGCLFFAFRKRR